MTQTPDRNQLALNWFEAVIKTNPCVSGNEPEAQTIRELLTAQPVTDGEVRGYKEKAVDAVNSWPEWKKDMMANAAGNKSTDYLIRDLDIIRVILESSKHTVDADFQRIDRLKNFIRAATAPKCDALGWLDIDTMPVGENAVKSSHVIMMNERGGICRGYRIHDGTGKYSLHHPFYNEHGQTFHPVKWMPIPTDFIAAHRAQQEGK